MKWLRVVRQWLCRHEWRHSRFQSLTPGISVECPKRGAQGKEYLGSTVVRHGR